MKRQILSALSIASMLVGSATGLATPAQANASCPGSGAAYDITWYDKSDFKAWEHPFACDRDIRKMSQTVANGYCRTAFGAYAATQALMYSRTVKTSHVWAHIWDGVCVYNN